MIQEVKDKRILASHVLCADGIKGLSLVEIIDDRVEVTPFTAETHSTTYIPTPIAILRSPLPAIDSALASLTPNLEKLHTYFLTSNLYHPLTPAPINLTPASVNPLNPHPTHPLIIILL